MLFTHQISQWVRHCLTIDAGESERLYFSYFSSVAVVVFTVLGAFLPQLGQSDLQPWFYVASAFIAVNMASLRLGMPHILAQLLFNLSIVSLILYTCIQCGVIAFPVVLFLSIVPAISLFTLSKRWVYFWLVLILACICYIYDITVSSASSVLAPSWHACMFALFCMLQVIWLLLFERRNSEVMQRLTEKNQSLDQLSKQLMNASYHKDQFLATVSHEMRTPLNAVMGYLGLLETIKDLSEFATSYVSGARTAAAHLLTVINDLLDFSQIQHGQLVLSPQIIDLPRVLKEAYQTLIPKATAQHLEYILQIDPSVPRCCNMDPHRLTQIIINLLGNALKFTQIGSVTFRAWCTLDADNFHHGILFVSVQDTGVGISKEGRKRIFEPFVQLNAQPVDEDSSLRGNGLGLAITQSLVNSIGGSIRVESEEGVGSVFEIQFPVDIVIQMEKAEVAQTILHHKDRLKILLVDDHATNRLVASHTLKHAMPNITIDEAHNGIEGFEKMSQTHYDLVLMDLIMPDISGIDVVRRVRLECAPEFANVPVIALTANVTDDAVQACYEVGMLQVLPKPFDRTALINAILMNLPPREQLHNSRANPDDVNAVG